jgi:hypothetical protein
LVLVDFSSTCSTLASLDLASIPAMLGSASIPAPETLIPSVSDYAPLAIVVTYWSFSKLVQPCSAKSLSTIIMSNEKPSENDHITKIPQSSKGNLSFHLHLSWALSIKMDSSTDNHTRWITELFFLFPPISGPVSALILAMLGSASIPAPETLVLSVSYDAPLRPSSLTSHLADVFVCP